jgi:translocation and assembly module TamA
MEGNPRVEQRTSGARAWACAAVIAAIALVAAGAEAKVDVKLEGLDGDLEGNARAALSIARAADDTPGLRVRRLHARAADEIRKSLQPFGYYAPTISATLVEDGETWRARYVVERGPQVMVAGVEVRVLGEAATDPGFEEIIAGFPVGPGDPLSHATYELGKRQLTNYAARKGWFDAAFDSSAILVDVGQQKADIVIHYRAGPRYGFGPVTLNQDILDDRMVAGYVKIAEGDPYDVEPLLKMQNELSTGPWFAAVEVKTRRDEAADLRVPIDVDLFPARPQRWEIGGGYGTDTGFRAKVKAEWRRLNRAGHHAEAEFEASQVEYSASGKYLVPWPYPRTELLTFYGGIGRYEPRWSESWRTLAGASLGRSRGGWRETISLACELESFTIAGVDGTSNLLLPGLNWTRKVADDLLIPSGGVRLRFDLLGAHDAVLSSVSFAQIGGEAKLIRSLSPKFRALGHVSAAHIFTDDFEGLPPTHRFVTGGDQTVRGYAYESLGPTNDAGDIVGGDTLVIAGLELEYRFLESWGLAGFVDSGNAWDGFSGDLAFGPGAGVRWFSPIGIVRLDGAFGLSEDGSPFRIHLAIGPDL